jgi:hypothetical protein
MTRHAKRKKSLGGESTKGAVLGREGVGGGWSGLGLSRRVLSYTRPVLGERSANDGWGGGWGGAPVWARAAPL